MEHLTYRIVRYFTRLFAVWSDGSRFPVLSGGDGDLTPVDQLLADLRAGTIADSAALTERLATLSTDELAAFETAVVETFDAIVSGDAEVEDGADRLEVLDTLANAVEATRTETTNRETTAAEAAEREAAIAARVHGADEPAPDDPPADDPPAEDPPVDADAPAPAEGEPVPVAAAVSPRISRVAVRRPTPATRQGDGRQSVITAAAEIPGYGVGQEIRGMDALTEAISRRADNLRRINVPEGGEQSFHVATIRADYPTERDLRQVQSNPLAVEQVVTAALGQNMETLIASRGGGALTAAGFCAPAMPIYDQIAISETDRPARDALPSFQAGRGRVTFQTSPVWTGYSSGVRVWTSTNDTEALSNSNVRKGCVRVDCGTDTTAEVYAIPVCVTVGNFFDRTFDERRVAIMQGVMAWQARFAERELLSRIATASTTVTTGQTLGSIRDVLAVLDRAIAGFFSRYRVGDGFRLEFWAPRWLRNMMRADLVRALPISGASLEENLAVADAQLERLLTVRGLNVTWLWDGERGGTSQEFGAEAGAALQNWPDHAMTYLFHPGAHRFLDGGELNLGVTRDSTLNSTNDLQIWSETFEGLMSPGLESLRIDMDLCPSGEISAATDVTGVLCTTGS